MKRVWRKSSELVGKQTELILHRRRCSTKLLLNPIIQKQDYTLPKKPESEKESFDSRFPCQNLYALFVNKFTPNNTLAKNHMKQQVYVLMNELLENRDDTEMVEKICEEKGTPLFRMYSDGAAVVELFKEFTTSPDLALQVFNWRRKQVDHAAPMTTDEYAKGIALAGRLNYVELADEYFAEAVKRRLMGISIYNALMGAFMYNGLAANCQKLYRKLKLEPTCSPTLVTYNILISVFGRLVLVDHMEEILQEVRNSNLSPDVHTYNNLIAGYITAWMWDSMEKTYIIMKADNVVKPDIKTHLLMLRGYAHSCQLEKMEEIYALIKYHVDSKEIYMIRSMISAYSKSKSCVPYRIKRIEELMRLIPENEYRPWLNVILICAYARDNSLEQMENLISKAFENNTVVRNPHVMLCIIACYFRNGTVDDLDKFVTRAISAGWIICRSLFHYKMIMYASQQRFVEMESVLDEMDRLNLRYVKKTFWILYKAYSQWGQTSKVEQVMGLMFKHGYTTTLYEYNP